MGVGVQQSLDGWPVPVCTAPLVRRVLASPTGSVHAPVVAPDGSWLATASEDPTVRVWDVASGQTRHVLTGHTDLVLATVGVPSRCRRRRWPCRCGAAGW